MPMLMIFVATLGQWHDNYNIIYKDNKTIIKQVHHGLFKIGTLKYSCIHA